MVPSPKSQEALNGVGEEVFEKTKEFPKQIIAGYVKSAVTDPIIIEFEWVTVFVHPVEFVTISCTV